MRDNLQRYEEMEDDLMPILAAIGSGLDNADEVTRLVINYIDESESKAIIFLITLSKRVAEVMRLDAKLPDGRDVVIDTAFIGSGGGMDETTKASVKLYLHIVQHYVNHEQVSAFEHVLEIASMGSDAMMAFLSTAVTLYRKVALRKGEYLIMDMGDEEIKD